MARAAAAVALVTVVGLATACSGAPSRSAGPDDTGKVPGFPTDLATSDAAGSQTGSTADPGGDGGSGGGADQVAACSLVTSQEAAAALGDASVMQSSSSAADCLYQSGGDSVIVGYTIEADRSQADLILALGGQRVDGVGDEAVQITQPPVTQTHVWIGDKHLQIALTRQSGDSAQPARSLLDKAMARL